MYCIVPGRRNGVSHPSFVSCHTTHTHTHTHTHHINNLDHLGVLSVEPLTHRRCEISLPLSISKRTYSYVSKHMYVPMTVFEETQQKPFFPWGTNDRVSLPDRDCKGLLVFVVLVETETPDGLELHGTRARVCVCDKRYQIQLSSLCEMRVVVPKPAQ